jgi:perosamine synthetase
MYLAGSGGSSPYAAFVCNKSDSVLSVIEKCLDNGLGTCLIVDDDQRLTGRISLADIRQALLDGTAIVDATVGWHLADADATAATRRIRKDVAEDAVLQPMVDPSGHLTGVLIDHSTMPVQVAKPQMTRHEFRSVLDAFISSWISSKGPYVQKFEEQFRNFVGVRHGVAVSNGTVALHLALVALELGPGDEVIVPDLTFAATINAVLYCGATPVIVDVDRETWCMTLESIKHACTAQTKAIIPVHLYGRPAEIGPIVDFARVRGIAVVEDCAEAHGARYAGRVVGRFGDVSCFSFYANKIVTTGEGGMCLTDSEDLATSLRLLRDHGISPERSYWHERVGYNYRMTHPGGDRRVPAFAHQRHIAAQFSHRRALPRGPRRHSRRALSPRRVGQVRARGVARLRASAGRQAPGYHARSPRGQDRDQAVLPPAVDAAALRQVRPQLSQQR